jgi:hypothetical protein
MFDQFTWSQREKVGRVSYGTNRLDGERFQLCHLNQIGHTGGLKSWEKVIRILNLPILADLSHMS